MTVNELANELKTTQENVIRWAGECGALDGEFLTRITANYVRMKHLEETHPRIFKMLDGVHSSELEYNRWVWALEEKIGARD